MSAYRRNLITGAVVLFALGTVFWMMMTFSGRLMGLFKPAGTPVTFISDRADGLDNGSPVLFQGVQVGKVISVRRVGDNQKIEIAGVIDNTPPLPANLFGGIKAQSQLSSSSQIELSTVGPAEGKLAAGDKIKIQYTGWSLFPPEVTALVEQARQQELIKHLDATIVSVRTQVETAGKLMASMQELVADPQLRGDLRQSIANIKSATERADRVGKSMEALTADAGTFLTDAHKTMDGVQATIGKTNDAVDRLSLKTTEDLDKLGNIFHELQDISAKINKGKGTAGALLNDPRLYDEMAGTAKELNVVAASLSRLVDQWEREGVALKLAK